MSIFEKMEQYKHEQLVFGFDDATGLRTIVAVHDTTLGPAVGGTRFWDYQSEEEALYDVLRLSRGMTLKNAAAGLKLGGGKAVIIGDPSKLKSREFFHAYGRVVHSLGGKYYTAEDVNTNTADMKYIQEATPYVTGTPAISGNPSPFTALGVYRGMLAGVKSRLGADSLKGLTVAIQGLGSVGFGLAQHIHDDGGRLIVYDIKKEKVDAAVTQLGAVPTETMEQLFTAECDVFSPCALGAVFSMENVGSLKCKVICGAANNVLVDSEVGKELEGQEILYCPDYIVNAGGIINCGPEITDPVYDANAVTKRVMNIYDTTLNIIAIAREKGISTAEAADLFAMDIVMAARK